MAGRPARDHWVVCPDYAAGPYASPESAQTALDKFECNQPHAIVRSATRPVIPGPADYYGDDEV